MLKDEFLETIFSNEEMQKIPIGIQATTISVFEEILENFRKENPYATVSELFADE